MNPDNKNCSLERLLKNSLEPYHSIPKFVIYFKNTTFVLGNVDRNLIYGNSLRTIFGLDKNQANIKKTYAYIVKIIHNSMIWLDCLWPGLNATRKHKLCQKLQFEHWSRLNDKMNIILDTNILNSWIWPMAHSVEQNFAYLRIQKKKKI